MFLAFIAWYGGSARGGITRVGQIQLIQPVLTLGWSALLSGEHRSLPTIAAAVVIVSAALSRRTRVQRTRSAA